MPEKFEHKTHDGQIGTIVRAPDGKLYLVTSNGAQELSHEKARVINRLLDTLVVSVTKEAIGADMNPVGGRAPGGAERAMIEGSPNTGRCVAVSVGPVNVNPGP